MLSCALIDRSRFPSEILTGPQTGSEGELQTETRARGVTVHVEPWLVREVHPIKDAMALWRLYRFLSRGRYDVVHTHTTKAGDLGRLAARLAGVPVIVHTLHGLPWHPEHTRFPGVTLWIDRICARWSDALVVVSEPDCEKTIADRVGTPDQVLLIRSGIEIEAYREVAIGRGEARRRIGVPDDGFVVVSVGRLSSVKAPLELLTAFERVARQRPEAHLVMVGDGPLRSDLQAAVAGAGLAGRVHILGIRRDVPEILRACDAFVLASLREGLARVLPQAMAAALPIVATHVDGAVDVVIPGENGWLVPLGDLGALAARLVELASDPAAARRMGERGRARVEEFSARRMVSQLEELYTRLAVKKGLLTG